ncbi:beta-lactamase [Microscilla marina ATCC 23134]|uniref:Beta-lactamase n=1 Tax=Microscilla marina ATCC 23134 TaxID=313606 RepID=A1ZHE1_MICM2|nr:beta-lactamase [Microscilla marina ATCC 23134]
MILQAQDQVALSKEQQVDQLFSTWNKPHKPGVAIAIIQNNRIAYTKGYGQANLEYGIPITPNTVFHSASLSKQFTAFSILLLAKQGKLSLDDEVKKYIPAMPDFGKKITLRHLATHSSGLRDQWNLLRLAGWRSGDVVTKAHIMTLLKHQKKLNFEPGSQFSYCNTGYTLLAEIVARVSGQSFADFTQANIFKPLGMKNSLFYDDHEKIVKNRAYSYHRHHKGFKKSVLNFATVGATSLFTTANDLSLWAMNFEQLKIGSKAIFEQMQTTMKLPNGRKTGVGLGQFVGHYKGVKVVYHSGSDAGYRLYLVRFPAHNFAALVLSNVASFQRTLVFRIADIYLKQHYEKEKKRTKKKVFAHKPSKFIKLSTTQLETFVGKYWETAEWYNRKIYIKKGALMYYRNKKSETKLLPISPNEFKMIGDTENVSVIFDKNKQGNARMLVKINDRKPIEFLKYTSIDLKAYLGKYHSPELSTNYTFVIENNQPVLKHFRLGIIPLVPITNDWFTSKNYTYKKMRFVRDKHHQVMGFQISTNRVKDLFFERVKPQK